MHVIGRRRDVALYVDGVAAVKVTSGLVRASVIDMLDHLPGAVKGILCFQRRSVGMIAGPVRIDLPVLRRRESHRPSGSIISARAAVTAITREGHIPRRVISKIPILVVVGIGGGIVFTLGRPDSARP